jgi:uncharacterized membrane protein YfcA
VIAAGTTFYLAAVPAAMLVGASKGGLPAIGMLAVPVLSLVISPIAAAGLLLPIFVATDFFGVLAYRRTYSRRNLIVLIPGCTLGVVVGWATAAVISEGAVTLLIGLIGLGFVLYSWTRRSDVPARPADWPRGLFWGGLAGLTSFVSHSGAPPYQVYVLPQRLEKMAYAGTTTILFAIVNVEKLVPYWALGQLSLANLRAAAVLFPVGIAATLITYRLVQRLPDRLFFTLVQVALLLISIKLIADGVGMLVG